MQIDQNNANENAPVAQKKTFVCPIDPAELAQCDSCQ
jgi:hypothetical protein